MNPIIMVSNFSGNVGKTTLTKNLLLPNLPNAKVFAVEDVNAGYTQGEAVQLSAAQTQEILEQVIESSFSNPVIVDVGASNVSNFFAALSTYDNMQEFITKVVVPSEPSEKVQTDTISTLHYLIESLGFAPEKISVVLNKVNPKTEQAVFGKMLEDAALLGVFSAGTIPENNTFQTASLQGKSIQELASMNPQEIRQKSMEDAKKGGDPKQGINLMLAVASAKNLKANLDRIFSNLNIDVLGVD